MEKKKNKGVIVLIILLILCIIGLVFYILVDKDIIRLNNTTVENEKVESNINDDTEEKKTEVELDPENSNIKYLFNNAHRLSIGPEAQIYRDGGYKVSDMSEEDKMTLLGRQWSNFVEQIGPSSLDGYTWTLYLNEDTLKDIYERTFGPNTYHQVNQITDGLCTTLTYDAANKRYSYVGKYGCGGTTVFSVHEK